MSVPMRQHSQPYPNASPARHDGVDPSLHRKTGSQLRVTRPRLYRFVAEGRPVAIRSQPDGSRRRRSPRNWEDNICAYSSPKMLTAFRNDSNVPASNQFPLRT